MTKQQLINAWLKKYPNDVNCKDLEHNALAGYVECKNGQFIEYNEWYLALKPFTGIVVQDDTGEDNGVWLNGVRIIAEYEYLNSNCTINQELRTKLIAAYLEEAF